MARGANIPARAPGPGEPRGGEGSFLGLDRVSSPDRFQRARLAMKYLIDPPSPFDDAEWWWSFLREVRQLREADPMDPQLADAEREAINELRRMGDD